MSRWTTSILWAEAAPAHSSSSHRNFSRERHGRAATDDLGDRLALDVLHDDVGLGRDLAEVVDRDDVGVVQGGGGPRLTAEALGGVGDLQVADEHLDGHHPPEDGVVGDVDRAHPAARELALDLVATDRRARLQHCCAVLLRPVELRRTITRHECHTIRQRIERIQRTQAPVELWSCYHPATFVSMTEYVVRVAMQQRAERPVCEPAEARQP